MEAVLLFRTLLWGHLQNLYTFIFWAQNPPQNHWFKMINHINLNRPPLYKHPSNSSPLFQKYPPPLYGSNLGVCGQIKGDKWHLPHRVTPVPCKGLHTHIHVHHTLHTSAMGSREETDSLLNGRSSMDLRRRCARQALICLPLGSEVGNMLTDDTWCGT